MKHIVVFDEYNEIDLKPSDLLRKYVEMTESDVRSLLLTDPTMHECSCPGCKADEAIPAFEKFGMQYKECTRCHSLFVSPRPDDLALRDYYRFSSARRFWREKLLSMTGQKRKIKIIKPRFEWIVESIEEYLPGAFHIADINTDQCAYVEEIIDTKYFKEKTLLYPFMSFGEEIADKGIKVVNSSQDEHALAGKVDIISLFEVMDRVSDVDGLLQRVSRMLRQGGLCFMTGILVSGFDIQILWSEADNIFPPDRLNVLSVEGAQSLVNRHGFECVEFSTPGMLDVEIVEKFLMYDPDCSIPRFIKYLLKNRDEGTKRLLQEFLQMNLLSSYGRVLLRKN
jgi:hypothetical protein